MRMLDLLSNSPTLNARIRMERCQVAIVRYFVIGGVLFRAVLGEAKSVVPQVVVWRVKRGDQCD